MAAFNFNPTPLIRNADVEPFNTAPFRQFANNRFGVYATSVNDEGETVKTVERNPYTGHTYSPNRSDSSLSLEEAARTIDDMRRMGDQRGFGLILYMPHDLVCVDFDGTDSPQTDERTREAHMGILRSTKTWVEKSASGVGYHQFFRINEAEQQLLTNTNNADKQIDTRVVNGFVFLTGDVMCSAPMADFSTVNPAFRDYLYSRCALAREAQEGSNARWHETAQHTDMEVMKQLFKRFPNSAEFLFTRQDQTGRSDEHYRACMDLIRCSLNYEQVKRMYTSCEAAEFAYRSESKASVSAKSYEKWLCRNINSAAQELENSGRFYNPDDIFIGIDEDQSGELEPSWTGDVTEYTPTSWIVQDIIPAEGVISIFGPSGSGKTFIVLDMMSAISCGNDWFGHRTTPVPITYVGLEGQAGLRNRVYAYRKHHGNVGQMMMLTDGLNLSKAEDQQRLLRVMTKNRMMGGILVVDTMSKSNPGMDENKSDEMSAFIKVIEDLARATCGVVVLVHHSGKDGDRGPRGHSSFIAALDAAIEVTKVPDTNHRVVRTKKVKDGADDVEHLFELKAIEIGRDQWDQIATSCVVVQVEGVNIDGLLANEVITDEDVEVLCSFMNSVPPNVELSAKPGSPYSPYAMIHELMGWPKEWDSKRTNLILMRGIDTGMIEKYSYTDENNQVRECYRTNC